MRLSLFCFSFMLARTAAFSLVQPHSQRSNVNFSVRYDTKRNAMVALSTELELDNLLEKGNKDRLIDFLRRAEDKSVAGPMAAKLLTAIATIDDSTVEETTETRMVTPLQEDRLLECYKQLQRKVDLPSYSNEEKKTGLFGSVDMNHLKLQNTEGCSAEQLQILTDRPLSAFRPSSANDRLFYVGGLVACLLEVIVARVAGISPQPLFVATFAAIATDQALGGGASEKVLWTLFPQMADRVLKHEAGHLLVAHLLGCPVQSVALGSWDAMTREQSGDGSGIGGAGTSFFDPELNAASRKGRVTRSAVDRFSIIVMAGIAAEALYFGEAEGGSEDENALAVFLSQTVQANMNIPEQARWAATNALILLRDHQDAYDRLVNVLRENGSRDIGQIMLALEGCSV